MPAFRDPRLLPTPHKRAGNDGQKIAGHARKIARAITINTGPPGIRHDTFSSCAGPTGTPATSMKTGMIHRGWAREAINLISRPLFAEVEEAALRSGPFTTVDLLTDRRRRSICMRSFQKAFRGAPAVSGSAIFRASSSPCALQVALPHFGRAQFARSPLPQRTLCTRK